MQNDRHGEKRSRACGHSLRGFAEITGFSSVLCLLFVECDLRLKYNNFQSMERTWSVNLANIIVFL